MPSTSAAWAAIGLVALVTFASRLVGPLIISKIGVSVRLERFLDGLSVSVIAALTASIVMASDLRQSASFALAALVMLVVRRASWAMLAGIIFASAWFRLAP